MAQRVHVDPLIILGVWNVESGLNPHAVNAVTKAQGLAQVLPSQLPALGFTGNPLAFSELGVAGQLPVLEALLRSQVKVLGTPPGNVAALMHVQLYPRTIRNYRVLDAVQDKAAYDANRQLDVDSKGWIDEGDLSAAVQRAKGAAYHAAVPQLSRLRLA
jgi:hypothetical protein